MCRRDSPVFIRMGRTRLKPLRQPTPEVGIEKMGHESQISPTFGMLSDQHASPSLERGIKALKQTGLRRRHHRSKNSSNFFKFFGAESVNNIRIIPTSLLSTMSSDTQEMTPPVMDVPCWIEIPARDVMKLKVRFSEWSIRSHPRHETQT